MPFAPGGSVVSEQNLAVVRQIYDAWDRNASARDFIAEDVEYVNPSYAVEPGTRVGRRSFVVVRETYEDFKIRVERIIDAGGDDIVVLARYTASGTASGVRLEGEHGYVWTLRDGQAVRFRWFSSHAEALEAAGISEPA
jgi:ketosteroid isomerase-like protein